jgi:CubicO group peptidase (beta-lactamase class C family)
MKLLFALLLLVSTAAPAQDEGARMDSLVTAFADEAQFNGSVLVVKKGKVLLRKGYGFRDAQAKTPNTPATVFNIASLTKTFTAALILKLQEEGKLSVHDLLQKYDPSFPAATGSRSTTCSRILQGSLIIPTSPRSVPWTRQKR